METLERCRYRAHGVPRQRPRGAHRRDLRRARGVGAPRVRDDGVRRGRGVDGEEASSDDDQNRRGGGVRDAMRAQATKSGAAFHPRDDPVTHVDLSKHPFAIETRLGVVVSARTLVVSETICESYAALSLEVDKKKTRRRSRRRRRALSWHAGAASPRAWPPSGGTARSNDHETFQNRTRSGRVRRDRENARRRERRRRKPRVSLRRSRAAVRHPSRSRRRRERGEIVGSKKKHGGCLFVRPESCAPPRRGRVQASIRGRELFRRLAAGKNRRRRDARRRL